MFWISLAVHQEPRNLLKEIRSRANCLITASKLQAEKVLTGFKSPNNSFVGASENFHGPQKTEGNTEAMLKAEKNLKAACNTDLMILEESGALAIVEAEEELNLDGQSEASLISTLEEETEDLLKQLEEYETTSDSQDSGICISDLESEFDENDDKVAGVESPESESELETWEEGISASGSKFLSSDSPESLLFPPKQEAGLLGRRSEASNLMIEISNLRIVEVEKQNINLKSELESREKIITDLIIKIQDLEKADANETEALEIINELIKVNDCRSEAVKALSAQYKWKYNKIFEDPYYNQLHQESKQLEEALGNVLKTLSNKARKRVLAKKTEKENNMKEIKNLKMELKYVKSSNDEEVGRMDGEIEELKQKINDMEWGNHLVIERLKEDKEKEIRKLKLEIDDINEQYLCEIEEEMYGETSFYIDEEEKQTDHKSNYQLIEEYEEAGDISVHYIEEKEAVIYDLAEEIKKQIEGKEKAQYEKEELQRKIEQERKRFQQELKSSREIKAKYKETKENLERIVKENEERKSLIEGFLVSPPPNLLSPKKAPSSLVDIDSKDSELLTFGPHKLLRISNSDRTGSLSQTTAGGAFSTVSGDSTTNSTSIFAPSSKKISNNENIYFLDERKAPHAKLSLTKKMNMV